MFDKFKKPVASCVIIAMAVASAPVVPAQAALVGTDEVIEKVEGTSRDRVNTFLAREDVRTQLMAMNISPEEAQMRVAALSDSEVDKIAGRLDSMPAGEGTVGVIFGSILLVFFVLLLTDLLGLTHVYGFTDKGSLNPNS